MTRRRRRATQSAKLGAESRQKVSLATALNSTLCCTYTSVGPAPIRVTSMMDSPFLCLSPPVYTLYLIYIPARDAKHPLQVVRVYYKKIRDIRESRTRETVTRGIALNVTRSAVKTSTARTHTAGPNIYLFDQQPHRSIAGTLFYKPHHIYNVLRCVFDETHTRALRLSSPHCLYKIYVYFFTCAASKCQVLHDD